MPSHRAFTRSMKFKINDIIEENKVGVELMSGKKEIGHFEFTFHNRVWDMGIGIDDEYQGKGLSTMMIKRACELAIQYDVFQPNEYLYIDSEEIY